MMSIAVPRTVPERRLPAARRRKAQAVPARLRDEGLFWIARQLLRADTDAERAAILLRVPDLVLTQKADVLAEACEACQWADGAGYIAVRVAAMSALRDERGHLPPGMADQIEVWRRGLVAVAERLPR